MSCNEVPVSMGQDRSSHEREIERLNRLYATLSGVNESIIRVKSREELFREVCRVAVIEGGFKLAWVGYHDSQTHEIVPVTHAGENSGFIAQVKVYADHRPEGMGTIGTCIREGRVCMANDFAADPRTKPWHELAAAYGLRAVASLPIHFQGEIWGVLAVYAGESHVFRDKEIFLFQEIAADIDFALEHLDQQAKGREAEQALRKSQAQLETVFENLNEGVVVSTPDGELLQWNRAALAIHGFTDAEEGRRRLPTLAASFELSALDGQAVPLEQWPLSCVLRGEAVRNRELRLRRLDKEWTRIVNYSGGLVRDTDGQILLAVINVSDITERKQAEAELRKLSRAVEQSPAAIVITNISGEIDYINPKFTEVTGFTSAEVRGKNPRLLKSGETPSEEYARMWQTLISGGEWRGEFHNRRKNGELFWEFASISPIIDESGRATHFLAVKEDITERKAAQVALEESQERFRALVENVPAGIFLQIEGRLTYLNSYAANIFGGSPAALVGSPMLDRVHPDFRAVVSERMRRINAERVPTPLMEMKYLRLDNSVCDVEVSAVPFTLQGSNGALVFCRDIGDRKGLEEGLRQSQKMEAIGQLAGGVAHDFNNILTAFTMQLSLLQMRTDLDASVIEALQDLEAGAHRAASLTRQLLLFGRRSVIQIKSLDLNAVVENILKMLRRLIGEQIELHFQSAAGVPRIDADPVMIEQVILNLAVNARDAMPNGGRLSVSTSVARLGAEEIAGDSAARPGLFACLTVADTGCGMDQAVLGRLFEPFFTTKDVGKGTGLGLATAYGIIKQHHGWITVKSNVGQGTAFRVFLPAGAGQDYAISSARLSPQMRRGTETILLVEDESPVRKIVGILLRRLGYGVIESYDAADAMAQWEQASGEQASGQIDLLCTDMVMPGAMNGLQLATKLRALRPELKVMIFSGYSTDLAGQTPADGFFYVPKPCPPGELALLIRRCLDQEEDVRGEGRGVR